MVLFSGVSRLASRFPLGLSLRFALLAFALCMLAALMLGSPASVFADELSDLQKLVEQTAAEYDKAQGRVEEVGKKVEQAKAQIERIERDLPDMQETAERSVCILYKLNRDASFSLDLLLSASSVGELVASFEYLDVIVSHNLAALERLALARKELERCRQQLEDDLVDAQEEAERASVALEEAKEARQKAEDEALERARRQEEQAAAFAQAELAAKKKARAEGVDSANTELAPSAGGVQALSAGVSAGDVDWSADRDSFVSEWSVRIDAYLASSPLAGQGAVFASAAWDNGVDPRWSPAISCVESTKGTYCFRPCNAWGWGDYSFGSWEESIIGHVAYLGSMYGSTITPEAASIYCPPNASFWYNRCLEEMALI